MSVITQFFKNIVTSGQMRREGDSPVPGSIVWPIASGTDSRHDPVATAYRCIRLLSQSVGALPLRQLDRQPDGTYHVAEDGNLAYLLGVEPMPSMSAFDFWKQAEQQVQTDGDAFIWPQRDKLTGAIRYFILLSPGSTHWDWINGVWDVNDIQYGLRMKLLERELIHLRNYSVNGIEGISTIAMARMSMDIARAGDEETLERFRNGGNVRGFLTNSPSSVQGYNTYSNKALKEAAAEKELFFRSGGRITYIPGNAQFKELMLSSADMQFLESRKFTVVEICRFFGVDPSFVYSDTATNYKSAENAGMAFLNYTLNPILVQIEQELRRKLLPPQQIMWSKFQFDRSQLFECDLESRTRWQQLRIQTGLDTLNEARLRDNSAPVEGGDTVLVSANLKSLSALMSEGTATETSETTPTDE